MTTEHEKTQANETGQPTAIELQTTPETTAEQQEAGVSSEMPAGQAREQLVQEVKQRLLTCAEEGGCLDALAARFEEIARRLGVPADKLIDEVFSLLMTERD